MGATYQLAAWISGFQATDLPEAARATLIDHIRDSLAVGIYGLGQDWTGRVLDWVRRGTVASPEEAAYLWTDHASPLRAADAAFANAVATHAFELDDFHNAKTHPGCVTLPAALALGPSVGASGREMLAAIAVGYEVMIRTSLALNPATARNRGWHLTGITGALGAAATAARLLRLDGEHCAWALGLGGTQAAGLFAFNADGALSKRLHPGRAAHAGILAAELAASDFHGPTQIYEASDGGYLKAFGEGGDGAALLEGLGRTFQLEAMNFKPYACCGSNHSYIDAALAHRRSLDGGALDGRRVRAGMARGVALQCGYDYHPDGSMLHAQMSLRYCLAVAFLDGEVLPRQFLPARTAADDAVRLAQRIELLDDAELDGLYPRHFAGWVEVETAAGSGRFERNFVLEPSGSHVNASKPTAMREKATRLLAEAYTPEQISRVDSLLSRIEDISAAEMLDGLHKI